MHVKTLNVRSCFSLGTCRHFLKIFLTASFYVCMCTTPSKETVKRTLDTCVNKLSCVWWFIYRLNYRVEQ